MVKENLGVDNIVKIQKNAAISRAESEKEIAKAQANAKREAKNAATPLSNVDKITMYGEGNSSKLMKDIMGTVVQVTDGKQTIINNNIDTNSEK